MSTLVLATTNRGKVEEFARLLGQRFAEYRTLADFALTAPEEIGESYAENAVLKAVACARNTGLAAFADDSGLEVAALGGAPGLHSARYAEDADARIERVLAELAARRAGGNADRSAKFVCVLAYAQPTGEIQTFAGECHGEIIEERRGSGGFGYDPIFLVTSEGRTMAELSGEEKDRLSHRGRALAAFTRWFDSARGV